MTPLAQAALDEALGLCPLAASRHWRAAATTAPVVDCPSCRRIAAALLRARAEVRDNAATLCDTMTPPDACAVHLAERDALEAAAREVEGG